MNSFVLGDSSRCIGCQACMIACARAHEELPATDLVSKGSPFVSRVTLMNTAEVTVPVQCRQCEDSPCANACPVHAIVQKGQHIDVVKDRCIGCKSCVLACPFGAIHVSEDPSEQTRLMVKDSWQKTEQGEAAAHNKSLFVVSKCDLCANLTAPACVDICPAKALRLVKSTQLHDDILSKRHMAATKMGRATRH